MIYTEYWGFWGSFVHTVVLSLSGFTLGLCTCHNVSLFLCSHAAKGHLPCCVWWRFTAFVVLAAHASEACCYTFMSLLRLQTLSSVTQNSMARRQLHKAQNTLAAAHLHILYWGVPLIVQEALDSAWALRASWQSLKRKRPTLTWDTHLFLRQSLISYLWSPDTVTCAFRSGISLSHMALNPRV